MWIRFFSLISASHVQQRALDEILPYETEEGLMERDSISREVGDDFDDLLDSVIHASSR